jgi:hypothetical protein
LHRRPDADCITGEIAGKALTLWGFLSPQWQSTCLAATFAVVIFIVRPLHFSAIRSAIALHLQPKCIAFFT